MCCSTRDTVSTNAFCASSSGPSFEGRNSHAARHSWRKRRGSRVPLGGSSRARPEIEGFVEDLNALVALFEGQNASRPIAVSHRYRNPGEFHELAQILLAVIREPGKPEHEHTRCDNDDSADKRVRYVQIGVHHDNPRNIRNVGVGLSIVADESNLEDMAHRTPGRLAAQHHDRRHPPARHIEVKLYDRYRFGPGFLGAQLPVHLAFKLAAVEVRALAIEQDSLVVQQG